MIILFSRQIKLILALNNVPISITPALTIMKNLLTLTLSALTLVAIALNEQGYLVTIETELNTFPQEE